MMQEMQEWEKLRRKEFLEDIQERIGHPNAPGARLGNARARSLRKG